MDYASTSPPRLPRPSVVFGIIRRDFLVARSYRLPFIFDLVFGVVNLAVFFFISRTFEQVTRADLNGAPTYFAFAAIGIALTVVIDAASATLAGKIRNEQLTGTLEALLVQPITVREIAFGFAGFPFAFAMVRALFYLVVAGFWLGVDTSGSSWFGFVIVLLVAGGAFSALGILLGGLVLILKRGQTVISMVVYSMGFLSGAYFPVSVLPDWVEPVGRVLPTYFAFDGLRAAVFLGTDWYDDALALLGFSLVGVPLALWVFQKALSYSKRSGSLTEY